jgi:hypothetical protein
MSPTNRSRSAIVKSPGVRDDRSGVQRLPGLTGTSAPAAHRASSCGMASCRHHRAACAASTSSRFARADADRGTQALGQRRAASALGHDSLRRHQLSRAPLGAVFDTSAASPSRKHHPASSTQATRVEPDLPAFAHYGKRAVRILEWQFPVPGPARPSIPDCMRRSCS